MVAQLATPSSHGGKRGLGAGFMMEAVGEAEPLVQRVFPDHLAIAVPLWLVCHRELHTSRRIRVVFDQIAARLLSAQE